MRRDRKTALYTSCVNAALSVSIVTGLTHLLERPERRVGEVDHVGQCGVVALEACRPGAREGAAVGVREIDGGKRQIPRAGLERPGARLAGRFERTGIGGAARSRRSAICRSPMIRRVSSVLAQIRPPVPPLSLGTGL